MVMFSVRNFGREGAHFWEGILSFAVTKSKSCFEMHVEKFVIKLVLKLDFVTKQNLPKFSTAQYRLLFSLAL